MLSSDKYRNNKNQTYLDVALSDDLEVADDVHGRVSQTEIVVIGQRLRGGDDDRVTRMDAERVKVLPDGDSEKNSG